MATPKKRRMRKEFRIKKYEEYLANLKKAEEKKILSQREKEFRFTAEFEKPRALKDLNIPEDSKLIEFYVEIGEEEPNRITDAQLARIEAVISDNESKENKVENLKEETSEKPIRKKSTRRKKAVTTTKEKKSDELV